MNQTNALDRIRPLYQYLRKQAENKKTAKYLEVTATFTLIAIFLFLAIKPTALAISSLVGEIKSKEISSQKMKARINSIVDAQDSFAQAQERYSILESGFPSNPNFYQAAVNYSTLAKSLSLKINQLRFDLSSEKDDSNKNINNKESSIESFKIIFSSTGSYQSSLYFIKELLNNRRLINISLIQFTQPNDSSTITGSSIVDLNIEAEMLYSPIEEK